jgi:hypothetical protein
MFLGHDTVILWVNVGVFEGPDALIFTLEGSSALKVEVAGPFKKLLSTYRITKLLSQAIRPQSEHSPS